MSVISNKAPLNYLGISGGMEVAAVITRSVPPTSANFHHDLGTLWIDNFQHAAYILINKDNNIATWQSLYGQFDFYESVLSQTSEVLATKTTGNRYIASVSGGGWTQDNIYEWSGAAWIETVPSAGSITFDENLATYLLYDGANWNSLLSAFALGDLSDVTIAAVADNDVLTYDLGTTDWINAKIIDNNIDAAAAIAFSKLAALTSANILVGSAGNVATSVAVTGDIGIDNTGLTSISAGVIVNADVNAAAAIDFSKLATLTSANILVGSVGNVATSVAVTGDISIDNTGLTAIAAGVIVDADVNAAAAIAFSKLAALNSANILVGSVGNVATSVAVTGDISIDNTGLTAIAAGVIVNADVNAAAAIDFSKLAALPSAQILVGNVGNVATAVAMSGDIAIDNAGVTSISAGAIVNADINAAAAIDFSKLASLPSAQILVGNVGNVATAVAMSGDIAIDNAGVTSIAAGAIVNADVNAAAAIDFSKLASLPSAQILVGNVGNVATAVAMSGDVAIDNAGVTSIAAGAIVNADVNAAAAIDFSKLASLPSAQILVGNVGNVATAVAMSGDVAIDNAGVTSIAAGAIVNADINAAAAIDFSKLATLTSANILVGSAGNVATSVAMTGDVTISNTGVTDIGASVSLITPDIDGGTADSLTSLSVRSTGAAFDLKFASTEAMAADQSIFWFVNSSNRTINLSGNLTLADDFITAGGNTTTLTTVGITNVTLPTTGTLATLAGNETLTTKAMNADSNTFSNFNADEMFKVAAPIVGNASDSVYGMDFTIYAYVSNQAGAVNIYNSNAPFKFEIIDAWSIDTSGTAGSWKLNDTAGGAGTDITDVVTLAGAINDIDRPTKIDTTVSTIASSGSLSIVPGGGGTEDFRLYIKCIRVN